MSDQSESIEPTESSPSGEKSAEEIFATLEANKAEETPPNEETPLQESEPKEEPKEEVSQLSKGFAALKRREKHLKAQEDEIKQLRAELDARKQEIEGSKPDIDQLKQEQLEALKEQFQSQFKNNPFEALKEFGTDYEKLTELAVEGDKPQYLVDQLKSDFEKRFEAFESKLSEKDKVIEELKGELEGKISQHEEQRLYNEYMKDLKSYVDGNESKYKFVKHNNAYDTIAEVVNEHYEKTQELLSNEEAADIVEQHYREKAAEYAALINDKPPEAPKARTQPKASSTLSNMDATENTSGIGSLEGLSEEEQRDKLAEQLLSFNN